MQISIQTLLAVGIGGFFGAITRLYITSVCDVIFPSNLPYGTLFVNIGGSLIIGFLFALFALLPIPIYIKSFLTTGFLGALTTYSTFAMETFFLLNTNIAFAFLNILLNLVGTIFAAGFGYKLTLLLARFF